MDPSAAQVPGTAPNVGVGGVGGVVPQNTTKVFVGQIPREFTEDMLRQELDVGGKRPDNVQILRYRETGESRGCGFVHYETKAEAEEAIRTLHAKKVLPGMKNMMQVKLADGVPGQSGESKLFVGMVPRSATEDDVRNIMSQFGPIEYFHLLRDPEGNSRGCAFVKYGTREEAMLAISRANGVIQMEGGTSPLVVKFADNPRDKQQRFGGQQRFGPFPPYGGGGGAGGTGTVWQTAGTPQGWQGGAGYMPMGAQGYGVPPQMGQQAYYNPAMAQPAMSNATMYNSQNPYGVAYQPAYSNPYQQQPAPAAYPSMAQQQPAVPGQSPLPPMQSPGQAGILPPPAVQPQPTVQPAGGMPNTYPVPLQTQGVQQQPPATYGIQQHQQGQGQGADCGTPQGCPPGAAPGTMPIPAAGQLPPRRTYAEGPPNSNLFVYHVPEEYTDSDLQQLFVSYGTVVSATIYKDKMTGTSKGFGFVSYDNAESAAQAVSAMNGLQIGHRRLKVELKKPRGTPRAGAPY